MRRPMFRVAVFIACVFALLTPVVAGAQGAAVTCDDFATQEGAQVVLDTTRDADIEDELDPDGDGIACDELPSRDGTDEPAAEPTEEPEDDNGGLPGRRDDDDPDEPTEEPTEEPTDEPEDDGSSPLDGRFGSPRDTWEAEWGDAAGDDAGEYPLGFDYEVDGFGNVNAYFHKEYVAYLTLESERSGPWTEREAERAVEDFLPADVEADRASETDDGDLLTPAHSQALEERFGEGTYEEYGATGERGDLYYLFLLDRNGDVDTIEVGLGVELQVPPTDEPDEPTEEPDEPAEGDDLTAEDIAYLEALRPQFDAVAASMDEFSRIVDDLSAGTLDAGDAGAQLRIVFDGWRQAAIDAQTLSPTPGTQDTHDLYIDLVDLLESAADDYTNGLLNGDNALLEAGDEKYGRATVLRSLIAVFLLAGGV